MGNQGIREKAEGGLDQVNLITSIWGRMNGGGKCVVGIDIEKFFDALGRRDLRGFLNTGKVSGLLGGSLLLGRMGRGALALEKTAKGPFDKSLKRVTKWC